MRVVVVGATGNVGSCVVEELARHDEVTEIVGLARRVPDATMPKTRFAAADVAAGDLAPHFDGAQAVVHLAWLVQPSHDPLLTWRVNVEGSIRVFEAAATAGVSTLVYASSIGAYSPAPAGTMVDESWPTNSMPTAAYGREKAYVERVLDAFELRHPEVRVVRLRPAFIFQRASATEQRRIFAGPLLPRWLVRPGRIPVLPLPRGLQIQALHTEDVAQAYARAVLSDVRGAFNVAAEPVVDAHVLGEILRTKVVEVPPGVVRGALATGWHLRAVPVEPSLLDLALHLPLLDASRARRELGWAPRWSAVEALHELVEGLAAGAGGATPPLAADRAGRRVREVASGVGQRP